MTVVLDSGGVTRLVGDRAAVTAMRSRGVWPPIVPTVVLTEALTGDHRRDFHENRLLRTCDLRDVDEEHARHAARLRAAVALEQTPSATDAIVIAFADLGGGATVLTTDPSDLRALTAHAQSPITIDG